MPNMVHSLQTKLTLSFLCLIGVISAMVLIFTNSATKQALKDQMGNELRSTASATASHINGDWHAMLQAGDEQTPEYIAIHKYLQSVRANNPNIKYIYTMRRNGKVVEFVVDADYGVTDDAALIGQVYEEGAEYQELLDGFDQNSADKEFTTDEWGVVLSGYAPIRNSLGNSVGLVGVDMDSKDVIARQHFIQNTIYYMIGIAIVLAGAIVFVFSKTIIQDIKKLNRTANKISKGEMDVAVDVHRPDEIGELADSFSRMQASLKIMMAEHQGDGPSDK